MGYAGEPYALPLDDVIQVLQSASQTYQVRAALPVSVLPFHTRRGEAFVAEVRVTGGQVHSCQIRDQLGTIRLEGPKALDAVRFRDQLVWMVQQAPPPVPAVPGPFEVAPQATFVPSSLMALPWLARNAPVKLRDSPDVLAQLTRRQRQAWLLIDGRRSIHEIAPLLGAPLEELDQELTELERLGLITSREARQERR
jgi:hypothetical protein